jgi:hypothetical protein
MPLRKLAHVAHLCAPRGRVEQSRERGAQALEVAAAVDGLDAIGKAHERVAEGVAHPLHCGWCVVTLVCVVWCGVV